MTMMKKTLLSIFTFAILGMQAQIFINTNPTEKTTSTQEVVPPEVETTSTTSETPKVIAPVVTIPKVTTPAITTTTVTTPKVTTRALTTTKVTTSAVTTPVVTTPVVTTPVVTTPVVTTPVATAPVVTTPVVTTPVVTTPAVTTPTVTTTSTSSTAMIAGINEDVPPNAEPGKCYARCLVEDKYSYVNESVVDQPRIVQKMKLPALYKIVYDTVVVVPASTKSYTIPAEYEYIKEQVMVTPTTSKWIKGKADAGCLSANPADCQVMCLVEVPAVYKTISKKILKNQSYTRQESIPMQFKIVTREVIVEEARVVDIVTPASFKTIQKRVLAEKGGYQVWREILCGNDLTTDKIIQIQKALRANGYNPGPIDDVFGPLTKSALIQYQKDKGLPVGNLNFETLKSLGVE
ncbi:MAG: hypothetical protein ACI9O4_000481 [Chitinophagales bacterium]|jgi:hypothetical protein